MLIDVHITDAKSGETRVYRSDFQETDTAAGLHLLDFQWNDGNFGCDCNRGLFFARANDEDDRDDPCGVDRYRVVIFERGTKRKLYEDDVVRS